METQYTVVSTQDLLSREAIVEVPQCYVHQDHEPSHAPITKHHQIIPTFDMKQLTTNEELEKLYSSCKQWGLFQLVNHGVRCSLMEKLRYEVGEFFKLPMEEKMKYAVEAGVAEGYGRAVSTSDEKRDWGDRFYIITNPIHWRKPHLLPQLPSPLRETLEAYILEVQNVAMTILELLGRDLKMSKGEIKELFENGIQSIRMTYYPPCPQPERVMGITPHSDATGITILNQLNGVDGLQIKKDGEWIPVNFHPDAFAVNIGDVLEILSNGEYNSVEHRAMVNSEKERISIAVFFNPNCEAEIGPAVDLINPKNPPLYRRIVMEDYVNSFFSRKQVLNGKIFLDYMRIKNIIGEEDVNAPTT